MTFNSTQSSHHIEENVLLLVIRLFFTMFILDTFFAVLLFFTLRTNIGLTHYAATIITLWILHTGRFIIEATFVVITVAQWAQHKYYIGDNKMAMFEGFITIREKIYELSNLRSVALKQGFWGRKLNWGHLTLTMSASGGYQDIIRMDGVRDPKKYERILREFIVTR